MSDAEQSARCAECGKELAPGAPEGLCPACLLIRGLETQSGAGPAARFTPPEPEELAGHFPQLEILELLGRGGMGMVYKARQKNLDRLVALKILAAPAERDPAFAERFAREAVALARLSHPHIVAVYDLGRADGGLYYLLMEYVDGVNVRQLLNNAQITPDEALAIVPQVCEALQYAHEQGIVHRDIKPENILIDRTGRVKIADFGLAKIVGREAGVTLTSSGATMGTPAYMAPEQIERPQEVDHRADVYSVGVVFYQMLTGELPMGRFAPPSKKVQIDVRLDEVILRALEKEPDLRWQQAGDVKTEVETIMSTPPPAAPGAQPVHAPGKGSGGPMKILVGALVLIAALVAAFVYEQDHKSAPNWAGGTLVTPPPPPPATTPAPAQPEATPSAAPAPQEQQDTVALLLSGKWNIMGKVDHETWYVAEFRPDRSVLVTKANGTQETREWTMDGSVISIIYSNHHDIFYPPLDPAGTSGQGRTQGFTATRIKDTEEGLLFSGAWQFTGMNVSATRVFNSDGSFTTNGDATASGKWWAETDKIVMAFRDGHTETMELPLNSKGTAGTDRDGNAMIASLAGNAATPPSPGAGGDEDIALLMAGRWYFFGASWSAIRTFYENGTFASEPRAEETGKWKRRDGAIDLLFDNGNRDAFLLPMDAKGTLGVDTHGFPCIAYLLGPAPAARPGATPSPAPTTANIPEETTTSLLVSGPWRMWGKNWSARRTFRSDGSFFSDNDSSSARGKWKITGGSVELSFEDGHKDILQLPLNPAGTRGVGGADSLGYVAFLVDSKGINPVSQVVAPGTPQEAATIKLLTSGQWVVRSETGGTGYLLRTLNADGTFSDHAANVDPDKEPGLVQHGKWRINEDSVEMSLSDSDKYTFVLPLNPRGTLGKRNVFRGEPQLTIAYLPSDTGTVPIKSVLRENGLPIVPQPGEPEESTVAVNDTNGALMSGTWRVTGINWQADIGTLSPNGGFVSHTNYTNRTSVEEKGTWRLNTQVEIWIEFENGRKCVFPLPLDWKKSYGMSSDGYAVVLCSQGEPATMTEAKELKGLEETQMPAAELEGTTRMLIAGTWKFSGGNWEATRVFRADGSFTSVEKATGAYFSDKEMKMIGWWKIVGETIQMNAVWGKETVKLPLDPGGTHGVDYKGGPMFSYRISAAPQAAEPVRTAVPRKLNPLNPAPPSSGPVRDTPPPRRQSTPRPSPGNVDVND